MSAIESDKAHICDISYCAAMLAVWTSGLCSREAKKAYGEGRETATISGSGKWSDRRMLDWI